MLSTRYLSRAALVGGSSLARQLAVATGIAAASLVAACSSSSDSPTGPANPNPGPSAYSMTTVRGMAVPHTFTDAVGKKLTVQGGSLTMNANGTFALNYKGKLQANSFDLTDKGSYSKSGSVVTFTPDDGDPSYTGRISGNSVAVDNFKIAGAKFALGFKK